MDSTRTLAVELETELLDLTKSIVIQYTDHDGQSKVWRGYVGNPDLSLRIDGLVFPQFVLVEGVLWDTSEGPDSTTLTVIPLSRVNTVVVGQFDRYTDPSVDDPYRPVACWVRIDEDLIRFSR